jgi:hypothetical protein
MPIVRGGFEEITERDLRLSITNARRRQTQILRLQMSRFGLGALCGGATSFTAAYERQ